MIAKGVTPILNVTDIAASFEWFAKLGWEKAWDWGDPPSFGAVCSGDVQIFLCHDCQGGRGRSNLPPTQFETDDKGVWMSIWVDDVDSIYKECLEKGIEVTWPPTDEPWNVREMHVRHPDGHVFRISKGFEETEEE